MNISKTKPMAIGAIIEVIAKGVSAGRIHLGLKVRALYMSSLMKIYSKILHKRRE